MAQDELMYIYIYIYPYYAPCVEHLPTIGQVLKSMKVNVPYMEHLGTYIHAS